MSEEDQKSNLCIDQGPDGYGLELKMNEHEELDGLMQRYVGILAAQKELKREKEDIKSQILIDIKMKEITKHKSADNIILSHKVVSRRMVDKKKVEDYCVEKEMDEDFFFKASESERLTIKQLEE